MDEFPKMLYRPGSEIEWEGLALDTLVVDDGAACDAALADGWSVSPFDAGEPAAKPRGRPRKAD